MEPLTQEQLEQLCAEWQVILRLQDWDVKPRIRRQWDMKLENVGGECTWQLSKKQAIIRILDPVDWDPDIAWDQDQELTLVHELLHLHFAPFSDEDGSPGDIAQEQAIHCISEALVRLKRGQ